MNKFIASTLIFCLSLAFLVYLNQKPTMKFFTEPVPVQYVATVDSSLLSIRMLILKHCFEQMADGDAQLAIEAINLAHGKGLDVKEIGNLHFNANGQAKRFVINRNNQATYDNALKEFISEQVRVNAEPGDTLIIFTIGHGSNNGYLATLGDRSNLFNIMAQAAADNNQETVWWQLSCYASARLPAISSLPQDQQGLFSVVASSDARTPSPAYVEGKIMEKVLVAMAEKNPKIDPNSDEVIVAKELADFLESIDRGRGQLVYALSPNEPLFSIGMARTIPIFDPKNPDKNYPKDLIQYPRDRINVPR